MMRKEVNNTNILPEVDELAAMPEREELDFSDATPLPYWNDETRSLPNLFLRTSLFAATRAPRDGIKTLCNGHFKLDEHTKARYLGIQLDQTDMDVWEQILHMCMEEGDWVIDFTKKKFLRGLGRDGSTADYKWLDETVMRLMNGVIGFDSKTKEFGKIRYIGHLIHTYKSFEDTGQVRIIVNPDIGKMYQKGLFTRVNIDQRIALGNAPLAKWIHGFYSSHGRPFSYKVETLMEMCGAGYTEVKKFRYRLKEALSKVSAVTGWDMYIDETDKVVVRKSRIRSLEKKD